MKIKTISSPTNSFIKQIITLHSSKGRKQHQQFIAEGSRTIATILASKTTELDYLLCTTETKMEAQKLVSQDRLILTNSKVMKKISTSSTPSGFLATFKVPKNQDAIELKSGIVLAQIQDPGNMGTLIRTAVALNKKTVVVVEGVDPWNPKVVQASAGTIAHATIITCSWSELVKYKKNTPLCALIVKDGTHPDKLTQKNLLLVVGNEARGIPEQWVTDCEFTMTLPMPGETESLNAAVAGSVALYLIYGKPEVS